MSTPRCFQKDAEIHENVLHLKQMSSSQHDDHDSGQTSPAGVCSGEVTSDADNTHTDVFTGMSAR